MLAARKVALEAESASTYQCQGQIAFLKSYTPPTPEEKAAMFKSLGLKSAPLRG